MPGLRRDLVLAAYGAAFALAFVMWLWHHMPTTAPLLGFRHEQLADTLAADRLGHGPLVGFGPHGFYPTGLTDDIGLFLFLPRLSALAGSQDPEFLTKLVFAGAAAVLVAAYPLVLHRLYGSRPVTVLAPALAAVFVLTVLAPYHSDVYWVPAWTLALALPMLMVSASRWHSRWVPPPGLLAIMALASVANVMRSGSGIGVLLAFAVALLFYEPSWRRRASALAIAAVVYFGASGAITSIALSQRDADMRDAPISADVGLGLKTFADIRRVYGTGHVLWHALYVGLGYEENRYGIRYSDASGLEYVQTISREIPLASKAYEKALRDRYIHIATSDPGFVIGTTFHKASAATAHGIGFASVLLLLVPIAFMYARPPDPYRRRLAMIAPACLIAFAPPALVVPAAQYEVAEKGALALICGLSFAAVVAKLGVGFADPGGRDAIERLGGSDGPQRRRLLVTAGLCGAGLLVALGAQAVTDRLEDRLFYRNNATAVRPFGVRRPPALASWSLDQLPRTWDRLGGTDTVLRTSGAGLSVRTTTLPSGYQLGSPVGRLSAGKYVAVLRGTVVRGGLAVGVLDTRANAFVSTGFFRGYPHRPLVTMQVPFTLTRTKLVRMLLTNWAPHATSSQWRLHDASFYKVS
jgi:hypothetical protein